MRGIRIKLSVFEFDVLKETILAQLEVDNDIDVRKALNNILSQFQKKINRANEIRTIRKGGICTEHYK